MLDFYKFSIFLKKGKGRFLIYSFIFFSLVFNVTAFQYTGYYNDPLSLNVANTRFCLRNGNCTFTDLVVNNLSIIGNFLNATVVNYNITGSFTMIGDIILDGGIMATENISADFVLGDTVTPINNSDLVNKEYVDQAASGSNFDFFLTDLTSPIALYFQLNSSDTGQPESTLTSSTLDAGLDQSIFNYTTELLNISLSEGIYNAHFHLEKTGGVSKTVTIYWTLSNRSEAGEENVLFTGETSNEITSKEEFNLHGVLSEDKSIPLNSRLIVKLYANVIGAGPTAQVVSYMEGTTDSHISVKATSSLFDTFYVRRDGTTTLTANWNVGGYDITNINNLISNYINVSKDIIINGSNIVCTTKTGAGIQVCLDIASTQGVNVKLPCGVYVTSGNEINLTYTNHQNATLEGSGLCTVIFNTGTSGEAAITLHGINNQPLNRVTIKNLRITGVSGGGDGIFGTFVGWLTIRDIHSDNNGRDGIHIESGIAGETLIENPTISGCELSYNDRHGLYFYEPHDLLVENNQFEENSDSQIHINGGMELQLNNNGIDDGLTVGVYLNNTDLCIINDNLLQESILEAIVIDTSHGNIISGNQFSQGGLYGGTPRITVNGTSTNNHIEGNVFNGAGGGIRIYSDNNYVTNNNFYDKGQNFTGVRLMSTANYNIINGNKMYRPASWCVLDQGDINVIKNNFCIDNKGYASPFADIVLDGATNTIVKNNEVYNTSNGFGTYGIRVYNTANFNFVENNIIKGFVNSANAISLATVGSNIRRGNIDGPLDADFHIMSDYSNYPGTVTIWDSDGSIGNEGCFRFGYEGNGNIYTTVCGGFLGSGDSIISLGTTNDGGTTLTKVFNVTQWGNIVTAGNGTFKGNYIGNESDSYTFAQLLNNTVSTGGGNPFNQSLNTTDNVTFASLNVSDTLIIGASPETNPKLSVRTTNVGDNVTYNFSSSLIVTFAYDMGIHKCHNSSSEEGIWTTNPGDPDIANWEDCVP